MNEGMNNTVPNPEELLRLEREKQAAEEARGFAVHYDLHPEDLTPPTNLREAGPEIEQLENMIASFESRHSLEKLHSIINLAPEEASHHPIREPARLALIPIVAILNALKTETNIPTERYERLKLKYKKLSRAVGMINSNKVDHNR